MECYSLTELLKVNPELVIQALVHLRISELLRFAVVSRAAKAVCDDDYFWKLKTCKDFGVEYKYPLKGKRWKEEYKCYLDQKGTELMNASTEGNCSKVKELLEFGVKSNIEDMIVRYRGVYGQTSLIRASQRGHLETVKILLEQNADPNLQDVYGQTALTNAEGNQSVTYEIVALLLEYNADINHKTLSQGYTALMKAARAGDPKLLKFLLKKGADPKLRSKYGKTARGEAMERYRNKSLSRVAQGVQQDHDEVRRILDWEHRCFNDPPKRALAKYERIHGSSTKV